MQTIRTTAGTGRKRIRRTGKKVTLDDVWATIDEIGKALRETQRIVGDLGNSHDETEKTLRETQRIVGDLGNSHDETEKTLRETQRIVGDLGNSHDETEKTLRETQRIVGDLGNKFGAEAEYTMIPGLPEKFKDFGFDFGSICRNKKINSDEHNIHAEIDAFLENGTQSMAVEVKAKLQTADVDDHSKRMEKLRKYADLHGDTRELFGALAAVVVEEKPGKYALEKGFYVIEPSGEDVKIIKPNAAPKIW